MKNKKEAVSKGLPLFIFKKRGGFIHTGSVQLLLLQFASKQAAMLS